MKDGFLLIDKESDFTSRDVCNIVAKRLNVKKVGHSGTLDPFATGLLIVGVNSATKLLTYLEGQNKTYIASLKLGIKTSSGDLTGQVIEQKDIPSINQNDIIKLFDSLVGKNTQTVPINSAVHVQGRKLYQYAHNNEKVELPKREIEIFSLQLLSFSDDVIVFKAKVSKGTYLRVLGEDIAQRLNTVGHLISLRRESVLDINVDKAKKVKTIEESDLINSKEIVSRFLDVVCLKDEEDLKKAKHGGKLSLKCFDRLLSIFAIEDGNNNIIAIYEYCELGYYKCVRGLYFENH